MDPRLPRGERRTDLGRPSEDINKSQASASSPRFPLSVTGARPELRNRALRLLEDAYERVWLTRGAAPRLGSLEWRPGDAKNPDEARAVLRERRLPSLGFDRATVVCEGGLVNEDTAQTCVLEGLLLGVAPATAHTLLRGFSTFARSEDAAALTPRELTEGSLLTHPARPIISRARSLAPPASSAIFLAALSARAGKNSGDPVFLALTLAGTKTDGGALRWNAEPDLLDVVRTTLGSDRESYARFFDRLGAARFSELPGLTTIAKLQGGHAKPAWSVSLESLPRNLTLSEPLWPTGSVAFELKSSAPIEAPIAFRIGCESPVTYVWSIVRLSEGGQFLSHFPIPYKENSAHYDQRIEPAGAHRLLLIGTNLGGIDLDHPYDPDHSPHEPHGCSVYLARSP